MKPRSFSANCGVEWAKWRLPPAVRMAPLFPAEVWAPPPCQTGAQSSCSGTQTEMKDTKHMRTGHMQTRHVRRFRINQKDVNMLRRFRQTTFRFRLHSSTSRFVTKTSSAIIRIFFLNSNLFKLRQCKWSGWFNFWMNFRVTNWFLPVSVLDHFMIGDLSVANEPFAFVKEALDDLTVVGRVVDARRSVDRRSVLLRIGRIALGRRQPRQLPVIGRSFALPAPLTNLPQPIAHFRILVSPMTVKRKPQANTRTHSR